MSRYSIAHEKYPVNLPEDLKNQWSPSNDESVAYAGRSKSKWICTSGHEFESTIYNRLAGKGCPFCSGHKALPGFNDLATIHPNIAEKWYVGNSRTPQEVTANSGYKALWICPNHEEPYVQSVTAASGGAGCSYCSGNQVLPGFNDLATTHPNTALLFHETSPIKPNEVRVRSNRKGVFSCENPLHPTWTTTVGSLQRTGCPYCSGKRCLPGINDLATTHPEIAAEWHPDNQKAPSEVTPGVGLNVLWLCSNDSSHTWRTTVNNRTNGPTGCPKCCMRSTSKSEKILREMFKDAKNLSVDLSDLGVRKSPVDIYSPSLNLIIEYDGAYWHRKHEREIVDLEKTRGYLSKGYKVVRIREQTDKHTLLLLSIKHPNLLQIPYKYDRTFKRLSSLYLEIIEWANP